MSEKNMVETVILDVTKELIEFVTLMQRQSFNFKGFRTGHVPVQLVYLRMRQKIHELAAYFTASEYISNSNKDGEKYLECLNMELIENNNNTLSVKCILSLNKDYKPTENIKSEINQDTNKKEEKIDTNTQNNQNIKVESGHVS